MAVTPLQSSRVSNALRTSLAQKSISRTQQQLLEVQNQIASGKKLAAPSDDPGGSALALQLRKTLEQRIAYASNLQHASSHLSEVDSTLGNLTDLLREAQTIASANVGSIVTPDERIAAASIIENILNQSVNLGNRQFQGTYLFGGDSGSDVIPFTSSPEGVRFNGTSRVLGTNVEDRTVLPFMADGNEVFGALSTRVRGTADLTPTMTAATRLADLAGATGEGISLGSVQLSDGITSNVVDLSSADSVGDVIDLINAAAVGTITASIAPDGNSILLSSGGGTDDITVNEVAGGTTAQSLGILNTVSGGPGASVDGQSVAPLLTPFTLLSDLRSGLGIDQASGITIINGATTQTLSFAGASTVEDLLNTINNSGTGVLAKISDDGAHIDILNPVQGISMTIAENGGTTAADLGIRSLSDATALSELNNGIGLHLAAGDDISITRRDGTAFTVDLSSALTIQDVINAINAADAGGGLTASFATTGNGLVLTDTTGGAANLIVTSINGSTAAQDLGIAQQVASDTINGTDVNPIRADGLFANLIALRQALIQNDSRAITTAAEGLQSDLQRVVRIHGQVGARVQEFESRLERMEDQNVAAKALLSGIEDVDYDEAITRFQSLQTTLQANLQTAARVLDLSLLDFLA